MVPKEKKGWKPLSGLKKVGGFITQGVTNVNQAMSNPLSITKAIGETIGNKIGD